MSRTPPARTPEQQKTHERLAAIATLDVASLRAWAERWNVTLFGDDRLLLISMHEVRVLLKVTQPQRRRESIAWLRAEHPESVVLKQIAQFPREFRGSGYR